MRNTILTVTVLASVLTAHGSAGAAGAGGHLHPAFYALPASAFISGSRVVRAGIESNRRLLRDQPLHFGLPPAVLGRRTGYYMDAIQGDPSVMPHAYTSYLVSIFHSAHQAQMAFDLRWDNWFHANYYTSPASPPISVGDQGAEALFQTLDPSEPPTTELFFRRGAILVEVFQGTTGGPPTAEQLHAFYAIATSLDRLAHAHPLGA